MPAPVSFPILALTFFLALAPATFGGEPNAAKAEIPWSFRPLRERAAPVVRDTAWPRARIDAFLLSEMEKHGLGPAPVADARALLRRLAFDLTGLPPSAEEVEAFEPAFAADPDAAMAAAVERLLALPQYGERWARHWLDLARYTDVTASWLESKGSAWLYRDWVVGALNADMPYDRFVQMQLAADLLPGADPGDNAALGFFGLSPTYWKELKLPPEIIKGTVADEWEEHVDALGRTFLGLTLACARCHDHKSDPVTMSDYYAVAGVFASVKMVDRPMLSEEMWAPVAEARAKVADLEKKLADLKKKKPAPDDLKAQTDRIGAEIAAIRKATPHYSVPTANGISDSGLRVLPADPKDSQAGTKLDYQTGEAIDLPVFERGDPNKPGEVVKRRFLAAFPASDGAPRRFDRGSGRLDLAEALTHEAAPLVARVMVNRVWRHHFGRGLVETPSEFGSLGDSPTHPELLDDLTARFVAKGWSLKWLHREILLSAAWRQSASAPESERLDPANRFLARSPRRRLDFESWRDAMLCVTGTLDPAAGGVATDLNDQGNRRRTLYGKIHRRELEPMLRLHDFPDPTAHSPKRTETTTPLQLLFTLNGPFLQEQAEALSARLLDTGKTGNGDRVGAAYRWLFQRGPTARERQLAELFLGEGGKDRSGALTEYAQALLGSNEFAFLD